MTVCCTDEEYDNAKKYLGEKINVVTISHDDSWMRDTGPTFVINRKTKQIGGIDWAFNGYSFKFPFENDKLLARKVLNMQDLKRFACPLTLEGGSIHTDGEGTLLTTEECLLKRNPDLSKDDIETQVN